MQEKSKVRTDKMLISIKLFVEYLMDVVAEDDRALTVAQQLLKVLDEAGVTNAA